MAKVATNIILDAWLQKLKDEETAGELAVCLCSEEPDTYTEAYTTFMLAKADIFFPMVGFSAQADGTTGRRIVLGPMVALTVTNSGTATHLAIVNATDSALYYVIPIDNETLVATKKVSISEQYFEIGDPV